MEYTVCFEHGMYVLEDCSGKKTIMMKPWWPYLPGDRVKENGNMGYKLVWRKECVVEGIVVARATYARILLKFPEKAPLFQTFVAIHHPVPQGSLVRIHLGSDGSIIVLEVKQPLRSRPNMHGIPKVYESPREGLPMPLGP